MAMVRRPPSICPSSFHAFKEVYLSCQMAKYDQITCKSSSGRGKGCIRFFLPDWIGTLHAMDNGSKAPIDIM